jgi:DNA invertase Pin-like site-specific DNA recombinase
MSKPGPKPLRCAIYTRVSTEHGLEQDFNSLQAHREAAEAYIKSQVHEGWRLVRDHFDDGGFSGGSLDRPALQRLLSSIRSGLIDVVVVYKVDRLTRSLADFAKLVELFDAADVSFVSVTQSFNTTTSMGRLTLNMLLSFAQFEREVTGERTRSDQPQGGQDEFVLEDSPSTHLKQNDLTSAARAVRASPSHHREFALAILGRAHHRRRGVGEDRRKEGAGCRWCPALPSRAGEWRPDPWSTSRDCTQTLILTVP